MTRQQLPTRRKAEVVSFTHAERRWTFTFGRFDDGRVGEIFLDGAKESPLTDAAREAAMLASLAIQFGCPVETIRHALDGRDGSLIGAALGMVAETNGSGGDNP